MGKAENFIKEHTRHCSNSYWDKNGGDSYFSWLTPEQALKAVEIAREEMIEKACDAYCKVCKMTNCRSNECKWISDYKQAMKDE